MLAAKAGEHLEEQQPPALCSIEGSDPLSVVTAATSQELNEEKNGMAAENKTQINLEGNVFIQVSITVALLSSGYDLWSATK